MHVHTHTHVCTCSLDEQCDEELGRCNSELPKDSNANQGEKASRDEAAKTLAAGQISDLQAAVDTARAESKAANDVLAKATAAHLASHAPKDVFSRRMSFPWWI